MSLFYLEMVALLHNHLICMLWVFRQKRDVVASVAAATKAFSWIVWTEKPRQSLLLILFFLLDFEKTCNSIAFCCR